MKISHEAREAALRLAGFDSEDDLIYWGRQSHHEKVDGVAAAMQSLINSTLERAQAVADKYEGTAANERCDDPQAAAACDISEAIGKLMESE